MTPLPCLTGDGSGNLHAHPTSAATALQVRVGIWFPLPSLTLPRLSGHSNYSCLATLTAISRQHGLPQADMGRVPVLGSRAEYERMYERSLAEPAQFWADMAKNLGLYFKQQVIVP